MLKLKTKLTFGKGVVLEKAGVVVKIGSDPKTKPITNLACPYSMKRAGKKSYNNV